MAELDLDALQKLADAATVGPWRVDDEDYAEAIYGGDDSAVVAGGRWGGEASVFNETSDARYIVAACNQVPDLIARVRELEAEVRHLREEGCVG